jgi:hypothetical protein
MGQSKAAKRAEEMLFMNGWMVYREQSLLGKCQSTSVTLFHQDRIELDSAASSLIQFHSIHYPLLAFASIVDQRDFFNLYIPSS